MADHLNNLTELYFNQVSNDNDPEGDEQGKQLARLIYGSRKTLKLVALIQCGTLPKVFWESLSKTKVATLNFQGEISSFTPNTEHSLCNLKLFLNGQTQDEETFQNHLLGSLDKYG